MINFRLPLAFTILNVFAVRSIAMEEPKDLLNRAQFHEALKMVGISESDTEILDRLFTLFDSTGDDLINFRDFVVGCSLIARGDLQNKLEFSFRLYDMDDR